MKKQKRVIKNKRKKIVKVKKVVAKAMWRDIPQFKHTIDSLLNKTAEGYMMYTTVPEIRDNLSLEDQQRIYDGTTVLSNCHDTLAEIGNHMPEKRGVVPDYQYPQYLDMHSNLSDIHETLLNDAVLPLAELSDRATANIKVDDTVEDTTVETSTIDDTVEDTTVETSTIDDTVEDTTVETSTIDDTVEDTTDTEVTTDE